MGKVIFETKEAKKLFLLRKVIGDLEYIGKESKLSETENELRKLAIKDLKKVMKL